MRYFAPILLIALTLAGCTRKQETAAKREVATYSVEDFYKTNDFMGGSFSPDKLKVLLSSNLSGIFNVVTIPVAGGTPTPVTHSTTNSIFSLGYFPSDERFLYRSDQGGNELSHIHVQAPDSSAKDLTPGDSLRADFVGWAHDDKSFFIQTNERDQRFFDLYEYEADGYARQMTYKNTKGYDFGPISPDKRFVALMKNNSTSDTDFFLLDRQTKNVVHVTPHEGSVINSAEDFTPDGTGLLFRSDEGREFASLRRFDIATGTKAPVLEPQWDIVGASYSKGGRYLLVTVNEDAKIVSHVYEAGTMQEVAMPGLPPGLVRGLRLSRDETMYAFYNTDGSTPEDLWIGQMGQAPHRVTDGLNPAIQRADLVVPEMVRFRSYDGLEIPGLLYKPHQATPQAKAPALVLVHGGPGGEATVHFSPLVQSLVNHGYVVFDINNRGSSGYGKSFFKMDDRKHGEADLGDVVASKSMLAATGYVDSTKVGIIGGSYGGYMTLAALTLRPDAFQVGVDLFGISNWVRTLESIPPYWESFRKALYAEMGDPKTDGERLHRISPLFNADQIKVPLMVLQGANDPRVIKVESDEIVAAAQKNGVPVEYVVFPDEGHGFLKKPNEIEGTGKILAFLDRYLKGAGAKTASS
jgi:prolyl oligopeptidase PreP (S9A serine peptidase family)